MFFNSQLIKTCDFFLATRKICRSLICKGKTFDNLTSKQVGFLVGYRKNIYHSLILEANYVGKLKLLLWGELCRIIDEPVILAKL